MIRAAVLGADVSKSRSPAIHNAAYRALAIEGQYEALSVGAAEFSDLAQRLRADGYRYLNVTIPHKAAAAELADALGPEVQASGAANTLLFDGANAPVRAENTDGAGLIAALRDLSVQVAAGQRLVMVGAGGAAAGAIEALTRTGVRVVVLARRPAAAEEIKQRLPPAQAALVSAGAWTAEVLAAELAGAAAVVSAVPAAAWGEPTASAGLSGITDATAVLEMAYGGDTPLAIAVRRQTRYADGLGMLVHQAARAIELALGRTPHLPPLFQAARGG